MNLHQTVRLETEVLQNWRMDCKSRPPHQTVEPDGAQHIPVLFPGDTLHTFAQRVLRDSRSGQAFECLMVEVLARFVNLPASEVDGEIEHALARVCELFGLQRVGLWRNSPKDIGSFVLRHDSVLPHRAPAGNEAAESSPPGIEGIAPEPPFEPLPRETESKACFPWITGQARRGRTIVFSRFSDLPAEAEQDKESLARFGTRSGVVIPFLVDGEVVGAVSFDMPREGRPWPGALIGRLEFVAEVFAHATARKLSEEKLCASEAHLTLAAASADAALWSVELATGKINTTAKGYELLDSLPGTELTHEQFFQLVHAEDRERVRLAAEAAIAERKELNIEYRLLSKAGDVRWVSARGRCHYGSNGTPERLMGASVNVTERKRAEEALTQSYLEIQQLKERLEAESAFLKAEIKVSQAHHRIIGRSPAITRVLHQVEQVAPAECAVLITGETGTGKELIAQEIHRLSPRKDHHMVLVNCAALPSALVESELFGRERGAYTGALSSQVGRFELADASSIFLDEIGELSLEVQAKLLRVLEQGEFQRLGSPKTHKVDVRVIAATNRDLVEEVRKGRFREDLYYRLKVFPIAIPPLRDHLEDVSVLAFVFMEEFSTRMGKKLTKIPRKAMEALQGHSWPGNIRELRNVIEHSVIVSSGDTLKLSMLGDGPLREAAPVTLAEMEREHILKTLESTGWRIKGPHGAAQRLDLQPSTLYSRMQKLAIPNRRQKDEVANQG